MNNKETKRELMEDESVPKALIKLGIPTMVGMMTSALYNLVDTYFVGTLGTTQVAAVSVAFPISLLFLAISLTNYKAKIYGESVVAGIGVANRILSLGSMMLTGLLKGYQPFVGYNFGAKKYDRARKATHLALKWSTAFCIIVCVGLIIFGKQFIGFFTKTDTEMINIGSRYLFLNAISFVGFGVAMVYDFMFLALGRAKEGGILSISRQGIFFIPLICILPTIMGLNGVLCAQLVSDLLTFVLVFKLIYHKNYLK